MENKKQGGFYSIWSGAILLSLVLVIFSLIFASCVGGGEVDTTDNPTSDVTDTPQDDEQSSVPASTDDGDGNSVIYQEPEDNSEPAATLLAETEDMGQSYIDSMVFLGDSTTHGLAAYGVVNNNQVWTPESGTLTLDHWSYTAIVYPDTGEEMFITDAVVLKKPEYLVITLGINGVSFMQQDYFISTYTELVKAVQEASPDTKIILNSIYPVAASYANLDSINNEKIDAANEWVFQVAEDTGVRYLDSCSVLKGEDGYMPESYQNGDGLHPTGEAYGYVIDYIRTHGYK
jgi:lysophospholipase L1-like esterase